MEGRERSRSRWEGDKTRRRLTVSKISRIVTTMIMIVMVIVILRISIMVTQ